MPIKKAASKTASTKKSGAKAAEKKPAARAARKTTTKTTDKKAEAKSKAAKKPAATELNYKSVTIEFSDKKYGTNDLFDRVKAYISAHPYIVAHDIELFIKTNESCAYFTVDGFSNPDFKIEL